MRFALTIVTTFFLFVPTIGSAQENDGLYRTVLEWEGRSRQKKDPPPPCKTIYLYEKSGFSTLELASVIKNAASSDPQMLKMAMQELNGTVLKWANGGGNHRYSFWGIDFEEAKINGANLSYGYFFNAQFDNSRMSGTLFCQTNLQITDFSNAVLVGADFSHSLLSAASFDNAQLQYAKFDGADISSADFRTAKNLTQAQIDSACYSRSPPSLPAGRGMTLPLKC